VKLLLNRGEQPIIVNFTSRNTQSLREPDFPFLIEGYRIGMFVRYFVVIIASPFVPLDDQPAVILSPGTIDAVLAAR